MRGKEVEDETVSVWDSDGSRIPVFLFMGKYLRWKGYIIHQGAAKIEAVSAVIREMMGRRHKYCTGNKGVCVCVMAYMHV